MFVHRLLENRRIFIIEDNPGNLAVVSFYLEQEGAKIKVERYGVNTVEVLLKSLPIDLILTDLMLPQGVSGFDVYDRIREVPELRSIPVIALSAADPDAAMLTARAKGFAGFISKPVTRRITQHVTDVLNGKQIWVADPNMD